MKDYIKNYMKETAEMQAAMLKDAKLIAEIEKAARIITDCIKAGGKVLIAGNGGSAGDAQHIAGEFINKFFMDRRGMAGIALTTDTSVLTAVGNDYAFERVFGKQIEAIGKAGDVFWGISTSGNSKDIVEGMTTVKDMGITNIAFTGALGCKMDALSAVSVKIPSTVTPHVQEGHIVAYHIICALVEAAVFKKA